MRSTRAVSVVSITLVAVTLGAGWLARPGRAGEAISTVQSPVRNTRQYMIMVQDPRSVDVALQTGMEMLRMKELPARNFAVLVVGEGVMALAPGTKLGQLLTDARGAGVRIVACRIAVDRAGLRPDQITPSAEIVPNGLIEGFRLLAMGYLSLEL